MWAVGRFASMVDFASSVSSLGFCCVELNHQVTSPLLDELLALHQQGQLRVSSVHDPCPNCAERLETLPQVSDLDDASRQFAVDMVGRTMELAATVGATSVVLHAGAVTEMGRAARSLRRLFVEGARNTDVYARELDEFRHGLAQAQGPRMDAVARSLDQLIPMAERLGLRMGMENRYYVNEIPDLSQALWLMPRFTAPSFGYWHDVGHAEVQARMGFARANDWLQPLASRMIGVHLHDVLPGTITDHQSAGLGNADLVAVAAVVPSDALRVCEFDRRNTEDQVRQGIAHLSDLGFFSQGTTA